MKRKSTCAYKENEKRMKKTYQMVNGTWLKEKTSH